MEKVINEIRRLAKERDAVILAHYYVDGALQDIADYVGDSFYLAKIAKQVKNRTIVFCGVTFMGESACILDPEKTVLMPDIDAVCPMALMVDEEEIAKMRKEYDDLAVVCYINSMAATKALVDVCVTSSNALDIVRKLPQKNIYFIPDQNLGSWIAAQVPEKNFIFGKGYCPIHHEIKPEDVKRYKAKYPGAKVLVHPECPLEVSRMADYVGSTSGIIDYATKSSDKEFIIGTETGVLHKLKKQNPDKEFHFIDDRICEDMKKLTLQKVADCLRNNEPKAYVPDDVRLKAQKSLDEMLRLGAK
ncbi:MAG: quinolinate synthase NadA [Clostridia bacterium]|nr:quinolinate synthase NadA [Clostridia bacterium]